MKIKYINLIIKYIIILYGTYDVIIYVTRLNEVKVII